MCRRYLHITSLHELSYFLVETYNGLQYYDDFISVNPLLYNWKGMHLRQDEYQELLSFTLASVNGRWL